MSLHWWDENRTAKLCCLIKAKHMFLGVVRFYTNMHAIIFTGLIQKAYITEALLCFSITYYRQMVSSTRFLFMFCFQLFFLHGNFFSYCHSQYCFHLFFSMFSFLQKLIHLLRLPLQFYNAPFTLYSLIHLLCYMLLLIWFYFSVPQSYCWLLLSFTVCKYLGGVRSPKLVCKTVNITVEQEVGILARDKETVSKGESGLC